MAGKELLRVQLGFDPTDWKPMVSVGAGVREIRIRTDNACRVLCTSPNTPRLCTYSMHS